MGRIFSFLMTWSYPVDALARIKSLSKGWDVKLPSETDKNVSGSDKENIGITGYIGSGFPEMVRKSFPSNLSMEFSPYEIDDDSNETVPSTSLLGSNSIVRELEFGSGFSSSSIKSDNSKLSFVDLKLGRLADQKKAENNQFLKESSVVSSLGPSLLAKRGCTVNLSSQSRVCQVHGCNRDLSSYKDYHKRHRVCDFHSKTAKVIVNGIEQRFCQQCSRFHLLAEFDDSKRSCRRRLAGHNKRRRKPQLYLYPGQSQKLLRYYKGSRLIPASFPKRTSFVFPEILRDDFICPQIYEHNKQWKHVRLEEPICSPQLEMPISYVQSPPDSLVCLDDMAKQYNSRVLSSESDYSLLNAGSPVQEFSGALNSNCALSLLSAQSKRRPRHSTTMPMGVTLCMHDTPHTHHVVHQGSVKPLGISTSEKLTPNGFYSLGIDLKDADLASTSMILDAGITVGFDVLAAGLIQRSERSKHCLSPESGSTVDLLQLSSHLQRVEQQRNSVQLPFSLFIMLWRWKCFSA